MHFVLKRSLELKARVDLVLNGVTVHIMGGWKFGEMEMIASVKCFFSSNLAIKG